MRADRLYHSVRLLLCRNSIRRARYLKKHDILGEIGEKCHWGPWLIPLYPKLIRIHDNVHIHKTTRIITHDMLNRFFRSRSPNMDFGARERLGCIELMDNVFIAMNVTLMPDIRIGKDCIITAGSVVASDIPENSVASGVPAKPVGRFDIIMALRAMGKGQRAVFRNQNLSDDIARAEWDRFLKKRDAQVEKEGQ